MVAIANITVHRYRRGVAHDLEDAAQETLCRWLAVDRHRVDPARSLPGFVALRARWTLADGRRRQARQGRADARYLDSLDTDPRPSPETQALAAEAMAARRLQARAVVAALAALNDKDRALLLAHDVDGVSLRTLAKAAGVRDTTLSRRRRSLLQTLACRLAMHAP